MRRAVHVDAAPDVVGPFSHAMLGRGTLAFASGQAPFEPSTGEVVAGGIESQCRRTLDNLAIVANGIGCTLDDAVRVGVYLADMDHFSVLNEVYGQYFQRPHPARTTVQSDLPGILVEIDAVFLVPDAGQAPA